MNYSDYASICIENRSTRHALSQHLANFDFADAGLWSDQADDTGAMIEPVARRPIGISDSGDGITDQRRRSREVELKYSVAGMVLVSSNARSRWS